MGSSFICYFSSPAGIIQIVGDSDQLQSVRFLSDEDLTSAEPTYGQENILAVQTIQSLRDYFNGKLKNFSLPLNLQGTAFQQRVWCKLQEIPYGKTISYAELAQSLGNLRAIRAVAAANGKNQLAILVPCHRVIGSDSQLVGYMGGVKKKKFLLDLEARVAHGHQKLF